MKLERRELVRQLSPETAVNVLLACWDYLETGEKPLGLSPIENVAFSSFMPDMDEAWSRYIQRITAKSNRTTSTDIDRPHTTSTETEVEEVFVLTMTSVGSGCYKLSQFMANHILGNIYGYVLSAVMNRNCMSYKRRENCRTTGPGLNNLLLS